MRREEISEEWLRSLGKKHVKITVENDPETAISILESFDEERDIELVGKGRTRYAYRIENVTPNTIVKLPFQRDDAEGTNANLTESYIWSTLNFEHGQGIGTNTTAKGRIMPVVTSDQYGRWLLMEEGTAPGPEKAKYKLDALTEVLPYIPRNCEFIEPTNIAFFNTNNVDKAGYRIYDYGDQVPKQFITEELGDIHLEFITKNISEKQVTGI